MKRKHILVAVGPLVALPTYAYAVSSSSQTEIQKLKEKLSKQDSILSQQKSQLSRQLRQIEQELQVIHAERQQISTLNSNGASEPPSSSQEETENNNSYRKNNSISSNASPQNENTANNSNLVAQNQKKQEESNKKKQTSLVLQTNSSLSQAGGVLTPAGTLVVEPAFNYSYYSTNQINVNGFTIVPGITFGNINVNKVQENLYTEQLTFRYGLTNRSDIYLRIPFDAGYSTTETSPVLVGQQVSPLVVSAHAFHLGDIEFGGSYQLNKGSESVPTFVANLNFKTITGTSPFSVPIFTDNSQAGTYLQGVDQQLPTGTGFYQLQPSLTILYPTSPVILFANLKYIHNFSRKVNVQNVGGGAPTPAVLQPGNGIGVSFGMGFSLNERTSFSIGYEEDQYFNQVENGQSIKGTAYDEGAFNFGLGYQVTPRVTVNAGVSIGVGPNSPAAQFVVRVPVSFNIF